MLTGAGGGVYLRPERVTEGGRETDGDKVKHRSDFRTYSEDKHEGRQLSGGEPGGIINPVSS